VFLQEKLEKCCKEHGGIDTEYLRLRPDPPAEEELLVMSDDEENDEQMQTFRVSRPSYLVMTS
jgi:hypothetical protein